MRNKEGQGIKDICLLPLLPFIFFVFLHPAAGFCGDQNGGFSFAEAGLLVKGSFSEFAVILSLCTLNIKLPPPALSDPSCLPRACSVRGGEGLMAAEGRCVRNCVASEVSFVICLSVCLHGKANR